jgi:hypothetical protein
LGTSHDHEHAFLGFFRLLDVIEIIRREIFEPGDFF